MYNDTIVDTQPITIASLSRVRIVKTWYCYSVR